MIRFQRSMQLRRGKHGVRWARELTDYMNTTYPKLSLHLYKSRFGDVSTVFWFADFKDLEALDNWQEQVGRDDGYRELVARSLDIVIDGTVKDTILTTV